MASGPRRAASFNLADLFESVADRVPDRVAVVMGDERVTYAGLDDRADRLAGHLQEHGVTAGARVGLQMENDPAYLETMLAAFKLRAVPVNINHRYVAGELDHLYRDAGLHTLVVHRALRGQGGRGGRRSRRPAHGRGGRPPPRR